jgi:hypothetical protein
VVLGKVAEMAAPGGLGFTRTYFYAPASSTAALALTLQANGATLYINNIDRTNASPGSGKQRLRGFDIDGTTRTPGAISIEHESSALGDVLAYFWPDDGTGYTPPMRQYLSSGPVDISAPDLVSGLRTNINYAGVVFQVPAAKCPRDTYTLYARLGVNSGTLDANVVWSATTRMNGVDLGPTIAGTQLVPLSTTYKIVALGRVELPTRDIVANAATGVVEVSLSVPGAPSAYLDEAWLIGSRGSEVLVSCGTETPSAGGPSNRLFLEPPSVLTPRPLIRRGYAADRSDSFYPPTVGAWKFPEFIPPRVNVMIVTTNAVDASASFRNFPRWHTSAAS